MNEPLRVAWLGHQSGRAGDGLLTYSRETVAGLRARGVKVFFVHHGTLAAITDDGLTLRSLTGSHRYIISSPRTKRSITDLLRREHVDLVHVSLSFSTLIDFGLPELCHELGLPAVATFHVPYDSRRRAGRLPRPCGSREECRHPGARLPGCRCARRRQVGGYRKREREASARPTLWKRARRLHRPGAR